jgi:hypothetical protein
MEWGLSLYTTEEDGEAGKRGGISIIAMDEVRLCMGAPSDDEKREEELCFPLCCRWLWVFFEAARGGLRLSFLLLCWGAAFSVNVVTCASSLGAVVGWHGEISFLLYYTRKMITVDFFLNKLHK